MGKMVNHDTLSTGITLYKSKSMIMCVITSIGATNYPCEALIHRQTFKVDNQKKKEEKYKKKKKKSYKKKSLQSSFPRHISLYREITNVEIPKPDLKASN